MRKYIFQKVQFSPILILLSIFLNFPVVGIANGLNDDNITANEAEIYSAFSDLKGVGEMIIYSDSITDEQLTAYFPDIKIETKKEPLIWVHLNSGNKVWILPSFYWGCFFGSVGVLVAGIVSKWQDEFLTDSIAGMIVNCNVVADVAIIASIYFLFKTFVLLLEQIDFGSISSGCTNVW